MVAANKEAEMMEAKTKEDFEGEDLMWDVDDRYSSVRCIKIRDPRTNKPTEFGMVYGRNDKGVYEPVRPVSERYHPIDLDSIIGLASERFDGLHVDRATVKTDRASTIVRCRIPIGDPVKLSDTAFDAGTDFAPNRMQKKGDFIVRMLDITNSYCGVTGVQTYAGWLRMICSNGIVDIDGVGTRNIHTVHQVSSFLEKLATEDYTGQVEVIKAMFKKKLTKAQLDKIKESLPKKRHEAFSAYCALGSNTSYAAYNFVSYLQTHEYTVSRAGQLNKPLKAIAALVAA